MTTELEKQFFDTFGIEPKETITCIIEEDWLNDYHLKTWYPISEWMKNNTPCKGEKECSNKCNCYQVKNKYPQITDRHYLELICILNDYTGIDVRAIKIEELKEELLEHCTELIEYELYIDDDIDNFKHQVQAIFEGER